jgi:putative SOS response-associated peptidase YedK
MCNEAARRIALGEIRDDFAELRIPLRFPEGLPNLPATDSIRITDRTLIVRAGAEGAEAVQRRWSWPGPGGRPVYNYRSDGRTLTQGRCLLPVDGFYEFTAPEPPAKRKTR